MQLFELFSIAKQLFYAIITCKQLFASNGDIQILFNEIIIIFYLHFTNQFIDCSKNYSKTKNLKSLQIKTTPDVEKSLLI